jgi:PEP-utilising enzyme, PEP-binding domain
MRLARIHRRPPRSREKYGGSAAARSGCGDRSPAIRSSPMAIGDEPTVRAASARELGFATSICGRPPSVYPEHAEILVRAGIDAIWINMDAVDETRRLVAQAERRVLLGRARGHAAGGRSDGRG